MKPYNKNNLINISIGALILLTIFFIGASFTVMGKYWWLLILPTVAAAYGCYCFYKKYHIVNIYKDNPEIKK